MIYEATNPNQDDFVCFKLSKPDIYLTIFLHDNKDIISLSYCGQVIFDYYSKEGIRICKCFYLKKQITN